MEGQLGWSSINSNQEKMMDSTVQTTPEAAEKEVFKEYDMWLHRKQGDQMAEFLKDSEGNMPDALRLYAEFMRNRVEYLDELAEAVERELSKGASIEIQADTGFIGFSGDEVALERLAEKRLLDCHMYED